MLHIHLVTYVTLVLAVSLSGLMEIFINVCLFVGLIIVFLFFR